MERRDHLLGGALAATAIGLIVVALFLAVRYHPLIDAHGRKVDRNGYQGIQLQGGYVYFGHLRDLHSAYVRLEDVYFQPGVTPGLPAPADKLTAISSITKYIPEPDPATIYFPIERLVSWENLRPDSTIVKQIEKTKHP